MCYEQLYYFIDHERMILFKCIKKSLKLSWKEVYDEKKSCSLKIRVSEVLLCFKDIVSDESTSLC